MYARLAERRRPGDERPEVVTEQLRWQPDESAPPPTVELPALFALALGEA